MHSTRPSGDLRMPRRNKAHEALVRAILAEYGSRPYLRLFRRDTGMAISMSGHPISYGIVGAADIYGFARGGAHIEIEVKTGKGDLEPDQRNWRAICDRLGVLHILARSLSDCSMLDRFASVSLPTVRGTE